MTKPFQARAAAIRYEAGMIKSEAQYIDTIAGHRGLISMAEIDLEAAERALQSALEIVTALRVECEDRRHAA